MGAFFQNNKILRFYSKKFTEVGTGYTVTLKELYAIISAIKYFK